MLKALTNVKFHAHFAGTNETLDLPSQTLIGAKTVAYREATFGRGTLTLLLNKTPICHREFWRQGTQFGWHKWTLSDLPTSPWSR